MNIREKRKTEDLIYQEKITLHLHSKQSQLETMLRVSMPHQLTNMKTILWINIIFIGFSFHLLTKFSWTNSLILFYVAVSLSLLSVLSAMLQKRKKNYGEINDIDYSYNLPDNETGKTTMLSALLQNCDTGIKDNAKIMRYLSGYMHFSTWMTLLSVLFFILSLSIQINTKGGDDDMSKQKVQPSKVVVAPPKSVTESSEKSQKISSHKSTKPTTKK